MTNTSKENILAIDTSTRHLKLALSFGGDRMVKSQEEVEKSHGQFIIKKIDDLFQVAGLKIEKLEAITVCTGPGSFTGLRIGLAAAKGIAVALGIPIVGVNLFEVSAHVFGNVDRKVHIIIPLNRDECFIAIVKHGSYDDRTVSVIPYSSLMAVVGNDWVAGIGIDPSRQFPELSNIDMSSQLTYDCSEMLLLGRRKLMAGRHDDPTQLEPVYVKESQAELRFEQRRRKQ